MNYKEVISLIKKLDRDERLINCAIVNNSEATKTLINLCYKLADEYRPPCFFLDQSWSWLPRKFPERLEKNEVELKIIYEDPCSALKEFFGDKDKELVLFPSAFDDNPFSLLEDEKHRYICESNDLMNEGLIDKYEVWIFLLNTMPDSKFLSPFQQHLAPGERILRHGLIINFLRKKDLEEDE